MSETDIIKIKILTRTEATERAVDFLKTNESPNIMPTESQLVHGIAGLLLFSNTYNNGETTKVKEQVFFPVTPGMNECEAVTLYDVLDFVYFIDRISGNILYKCEFDPGANYIISNGVCGVFYDEMLKSKIVSLYLKSIKENINKFYSEILSEIASKILNKSSVTKLQCPPLKPVSDYLFPPDLSEVSISDRLDIISYYEQHTVFVVEDQMRFLLINTEDKQFVSIYKPMRKYTSIYTIVEDCNRVLKR